MITVIEGVAYLAYMKEAKAGDMVIRGHARTGMFVDTAREGTQEWVVVKTGSGTKAIPPVAWRVGSQDILGDIADALTRAFPFDDDPLGGELPY